MGRRNATRRQLLKGAAAASVGAIGFPYIVPASALGKDGNVAPSNRLILGAIGTGGQGRGNMGRLMNIEGVHCVAVCDVDANHRNQARDSVNDRYGNKDCAAYNDFRELVARKDIDIVCVGTPDHWHGIASVAALREGKDVYCEKPLANSIAEGRAIADTAKKYNRILQTGSQERSGERARRACELVRSGRIGKVHTVEINLPCSDGHHKEMLERNKHEQPLMPVPSELDYDMWLGHTPLEPYTKNRCHFAWRFILNYGGGEMTDRGAHVIDIAQLGLGMDDSGPVEIEGTGEASETGLYDSFFSYRFECKYPNGVRMVGRDGGTRGLKFIGDEGWMFIHIHGAKLESDPPSLKDEHVGDDGVHLGRSPGHHQNFIDSVRSRKDPVATAEIGHRTASVCHLVNIAMRTGRKLKWDPVKEVITNDAEAQKLVSPSMRFPWDVYWNAIT